MAQYTQINPDALVTALTPINNSLGGKQDKTDNTLATTDKTISGAINEINTKVGNLTGALTWKGKFDTLPAVTDYEAGNVVGVGNKEYVLTVTGSTKAWEELGDEGSYLLKSVAEETYLKKAAGAVTTANIADGAVISTKLATGARRPIILTIDTTEVDEETYQKLLSDDVDVIFKVEGGELCILTYKHDNKDYLALYFTCLSVEGSVIDYSLLYAYEVDITKTSPHTCSISENFVGSFVDFINEAGYLTEAGLKPIFNPILKEIDLTGTDADRKAKLDQFAADWKYLTGADTLDGARFVGYYETPSEGVGVFSYNTPNGTYSSILTDSNLRSYQVSVEFNGTLTITPLFSHLEAITISIDNTPESKAANVAAIEAYEDNLEALGFDTTKGYMIPITASGRNGFLSTRSGNYPYAGYVAADSSVNDFYNILILGNGEYYDSKIQSENSSELNTISKKLVPAINEVNTLAKSKGNGTITGVKMNGVSKGTSGVVDLGTVITAHQDISGKVDKTTLLNTLMVVDLSSDDITVRKAALDDFKAKWLALGNTDLTGARFIGRFSDTNGNTSIHESGKFLMGEDTLLIYRQVSPAFPMGFYGLSYIKDMANSLCGLYQIYVDYDTTNNPGNVEITQIRDSETFDWLNRFVYGEAPSTYLKITDAESTYAKKTSIPTVNDPKVSIKMNGAEKGSFTLNQVSAGEVDLGTVITAHQDISGKVDKTLNAKAFEGITIQTTNSAADKAANVEAIKAYVNNLKTLGVDTTKGFNVPVKIGNFYGCLTGRYITGVEGCFLSGTIFSVDGGEYYIKDIYITPVGLYMELVDIKNDNVLNTTSKDLIGAINEVNTLAKSKGNGTITGVKMNGVSKGTSGVVDLGTVITAHQDISGKVDKTTLLNTLMVVDLSSDDIAVRKAALDDFKAKWLALGNTDLTGARFIAKGSFNLPSPPDNNVIMTYVENGLVATGYIGIAITTYNSIIGAYRVNIALDGTMSSDAIKDLETTDAFRNFAWGEVPATYLKITDAESTYATKTHVAETLTETLRDYAKSEEVFAMSNMATANAKNDVSLVLKEIDLTGTDADRKAKLDQFAKDWKILTHATDMTGARFACHMTTTTGEGYAILVYDSVDGAYIGVVTDDSYKSYIVHVLESNGSIFAEPVGGNTETDTSMSDTSTNPVQNKVIKAYIDGLVGNVAARLAQI